MQIPTSWQGRALRGHVSVPGDKSISHRAALFAALADGTSQIKHFAPGEDCRSTLSCLQQLGIQWQMKGERLTVMGRGLAGLAEPIEPLNAGNSGTTMRLLAGILAGQPFASFIDGDASLRQRPMGRITMPLRQMGASIIGRRDHSLAPLAICGGQLYGMNYMLPVASAQVKSALLLAGLFAEAPTTVIEPAPTRDHTERMLRRMGASLVSHGSEITIAPHPVLAPLSMQIPGDFSTAAYFLAAGLLVPGADITVTGAGINPTRTGLLTILASMGAHVEVLNSREEGGEPTADLRVTHSQLRAMEVSGDLVSLSIDELPLVAVLATQAQGRSVIRDAQELRVKESDRIKAMAVTLTAMGANIHEREDGWEIEGPTPLAGVTVDSHSDHRIAMALSIAALIAHGEVTIRGAEWVRISYPTFFTELARLAGDA